MTKQAIYIIRQCLLTIIALQILNLSVGSSWLADNSTYDYSYTYNKTYDPTESAVEWIVELNCGQQPGFSYNLREDTGKSMSKSLHWKTDLQQRIEEHTFVLTVAKPRMELPALLIHSRTQETFSPPPEALLLRS